MYDTLLGMGFRGEIDDLINSRQHTAIFDALDKTAAYTEQGSFTHDGVRYSMPKALSRSSKKRTRNFKISDLDWVLKHDTPSPDRVQKADLSAPILIAKDKKGRLTAVDGLHRLTKAVQSGASTIPGKYLSKRDLRMSRVGHVNQRIQERAPKAQRDILKIRRALKKKKLKRGQTYYAPVTGGYAVIGDVGRQRRRHVVKTVLSPEMKPPGLPLYGLTKESVDKQALKEAIIAAGTTIPSKEHLKNYPHHAALNLGQAAFYASKIRKEPKLTADMIEQILYAVLPPTHHTKKEIENMRRKGGLRYWYKQGRG